MSSETYVVVAYVIGLGALLGYGLVLWAAERAHNRRGPHHGAKS